MKTILIIGSNSPLAKKFIVHTINKFKLIGATTSDFDNEINIEWINIKQSLFKLKEKLSSTDFIINFSWSRTNNLENIKLNQFLINHKEKSTKIIFISSISASPKSKSHYSKNKFLVSELIKTNNEINVMLGLVDHQRSTQINQLIKIITILPFSLRFSYNFFNIYLIHQHSFLMRLEELVLTDKKAGNYAMYDKILGINDFIEFLETKHVIKKKFNITFPVFLIKFLLLFLNIIPIKISLFDKLLTFVYKDAKWINNLD
jgi:hypothetical protein